MQHTIHSEDRCFEQRQIPRRAFLAGALAATGGLSALSRPASAVAQPQQERESDPRFPYCAFVKFLQSLDYETLAQTVAELGFDGIEATVRNGGQVLPERVEEDLPRLVEALRKHGVEITVMASSVNSVDQPLTEKVLKTAAALGIRRYRMAYYQYDLKQPVLPQLEALRPTVRELAALNAELGLTAVYQNHAGAKYVGASIWDLERLLRDVSPEQIGVAFDIRHATCEGGLTWPVSWNVIRPHVGAVYAKDFRWDGRRPHNVPLGTGQVDPDFFRQLARSDWRGPISLHIEYLEDAGIQPNVEALRVDLATLKQLLGE